MKIKSIFSLAVAGCLAFGFASCSDDKEQKKNSDSVVKEAKEEVKDAEDAEVTEVVDVPKGIDGAYEFKGAINGKYGINMKIVVNNGQVAGSYYYTKHHAGDLKLFGSSNGNKITMYEVEPARGLQSGMFEGTIQGNQFVGTFTNLLNGKKMPFSITTDGRCAIPDNLPTGTDWMSFDYDGLISSLDNYLETAVAIAETAYKVNQVKNIVDDKIDEAKDMVKDKALDAANELFNGALDDIDFDD